MSDVVVQVSYKRPFNVVGADNQEFPWVVCDADGEPLAYCPDMATADLLIDALEKEPAKDDLVTYTVSG